MADPSKVNSKQKGCVEKLQNLFFTVSPLIKAQRLQRGGFELQLEPKLPYQDEGRIGTIVASSKTPIRSLLTELLILTNKVVATHINALGVPGIYCIQPEPDWEELEDLLKLVQNLGIEFNLQDDEEIIPRDYHNLTQLLNKSSHVNVLNYLF